MAASYTTNGLSGALSGSTSAARGNPLKLSRAAKRELKLPQLLEAMKKASTVMEPYRVNRKMMVDLEASNQWGTDPKVRRPWNGIGLFRRVVLEMLVNTSPRALLSTWRREGEIKRAVRSAGDWGNKQFERINLGDNLRRWFDDALYWMGVMMVGVTTPADAHRTGWRTSAGEAFAVTVDPDDYICDVFARVMEELSFEGNRFRGNVEVLNRMHNLTGEKKLQAGGPQSFNDDGDERVGVLGRGYEGGEYDCFGEMVDAWQFYLPGHGFLLTFRSNSGRLPNHVDDLIASEEYIGPGSGPYEKLGFQWVPGNLFPRGPIMDLYPLDVSINGQLRKLLRQAERYKQNDVYSGAAAKDMAKIVASDDGVPVLIEHLDQIRPWASQPPSAQLSVFTQSMMALFNELGGNYKTLGGLGRQAGTVGQEQLINQNAAGFIGGLQRTANKGTSRVMNKLFWQWHYDPLGVMRVEYPLESDRSRSIVREIYPAGTPGVEYTRDFDWDDMEVKVDPYSMTADTPQSKLAHLRSLVQVLTPMEQMMAREGMAIDRRFWLTKEGEYANNPDVSELVHLTEPIEAEAGGLSHERTKPAATSRTVTRRNESEATDEGQAKDLMQQMMGAGAQEGAEPAVMDGWR